MWVNGKQELGKRLTKWLGMTVFLLLSRSYIAIGQNIITFNESYKFSYCYDKLHDKPEFPSKAYLQAGLNSDSIIICFINNIEARIVKSKNIYNITLNFTTDSITTNFIYDELNLRNMIFPWSGDIKIQLLDKNSGKSELFSLETFGFPSNFQFDTLVTDESNMKYFEIELISVKYDYSKIQIEKFDQAFKSKEELIKLKSKLVEIEQKLLVFANAKPGMIRLYNSDLKSVEEELTYLINNEKQSDLRLIHENDGYIDKLEKLNSRAKLLRVEFDRKLNSLEYAYFCEARNQYHVGNFEIAMHNISQALEAKPEYKPALFYKSRVEMILQDFENCTNTLILSNKTDENNSDYKDSIRETTKYFYDFLCKKADSLNEIHKFNEAVKLLEMALNMNDSIEMLKENFEAFNLMKNSKMGLFDSWISITESTIKTSNISLSLDYLKWTNEYYEANRKFIDDLQEVSNLNMKLSKKCIQRASYQYYKNNNKTAANYYIHIADSLNSKVESQPALAEIEYYQSIFNENQAVVEMVNHNQNVEEIDSNASKPAELIQIKKEELTEVKTSKKKRRKLRKKIEDIYNQGVELYDAGQYDLAQEAFEQVDIARIEYNFLGFGSTSIYLSNIVKKKIESKLADAIINSDSMSYEQLDALLKSIHASLIAGKIEYYYEVDSKMRVLKYIMNQKKCEASSQEFSKLKKLGFDNIFTKDYKTAIRIWNEAKKISKENPSCLLDTNDLCELMSRYIKPVSYQEKLDSVELLIRNGNDSIAVSFFMECHKYYYQNNLLEFNIFPPSLELIIEKYPLNKNLAYYSLSHFIETKNSNTITKILKEIANEKGDLNRLQINNSLKYLAGQDLKNNPRSSASSLATYRFGKSKTTKRLRCKYLSENKNLRRNVNGKSKTSLYLASPKCMLQSLLRH